MELDVLIVGGSYAGLSAALQLARARRRVLVIDAGRRRNRFASTSHGFLGRDGVDPAAIVAEAVAQLRAYPTVAWHAGSATAAARLGDGFAVTTDDGARHVGRRLVLATGVEDVLPDVPGLAERWGRTVFHCPYCHGYELGGAAVGVLATGPMSVHQAFMLPDWGPTTFFTNQAVTLDPESRDRLARRGVVVEEVPVVRLEGEDSVHVLLKDGRTLDVAGVFTASRVRPGPLVAQLGCATEEGPLGPFATTDLMKETTVRGVFACGDVGRAMTNIALAVADGAMAGAGAHASLMSR
jgi:thioredoxin reductase